MAIQLQSGYSFSTTIDAQDTLTLTAPTGITSGDLLLIIVMDDADDETASLFQTPAGWTSIGSEGDGTSDAWVHAFYKISDGTEGNTTISHSSVADELIGWMLRVTETSATPLGVVGTGISQSGSTSLTIPSLTTTDDNSLVFYAMAGDGGDMAPFATSSSGWTEEAEGVEGNGGSSTSGSFGTNLVASSGTASGDVVITAALTDGMSGLQFEILSENSEILDATPGSYNSTGTDVTLEHDKIITLLSDNYNSVGTDLSLIYGRKLVVESTSYGVSTTDITMRNHRIIIDSESYGTTVTDIILGHGLETIIEPIDYIGIGTDISLVYGHSPYLYNYFVNIPSDDEDDAVDLLDSIRHSYDNSSSGLLSRSVQKVLDEIHQLILNVKSESTMDFDAVDNQTIFTTDYDIDNVSVYVGGIKFRDTEYTANNGTSITLNSGVDADTWVQVVTWI